MRTPRRSAQQFALTLCEADVAQAIAMTASVIGKLEELLALDALPTINGFTPRRAALADALTRARETLAILRGRAS